MARPKQVRTSTVPAYATQVVTVANYARTFPEHADRLAGTLDKLLDLGPTYKTSTIAAAIACCRFVAAKSPRIPYEPTAYCQKTKPCVRCYYGRHRGRAKALAEQAFDPQANHVRRCLIQFVFTTPAPTSYEQSVLHARSAIASLSPLANAIGAWNRKRKERPSEQIYGYGIGTHLKPIGNSPFLWAHLHLSLIAGSRVVLQGTQMQGLREYLSLAFQHAAGLVDTPVVKTKIEGWIGEQCFSVEERKKRKRGKVVSPTKLENIFAYDLRNDEDDDTNDVAIARRRLLEELGDPLAFTRSRTRNINAPDDLEPSPGHAKPRTSTSAPSEFHPVRLGKQYIYMFPLDGTAAVQIAPEDYDTRHKLLFDEAIKLVEQYRTEHQTLSKDDHVTT